MCVLKYDEREDGMYYGPRFEEVKESESSIRKRKTKAPVLIAGVVAAMMALGIIIWSALAVRRPVRRSSSSALLPVAVERAVKTGDFSQVQLSGSHIVQIDCSGEGPSVELIGGSGSGVKIEEKKGILYISGGTTSTRRRQTVLVKAPDLEAVASTGSSDITVRGVNRENFRVISSGSLTLNFKGDVKTFLLKMSGSGNAKLKGRATVLKIDSSGSVNVEAKELTSHYVFADVSGAGKAEVFALTRLKADVSGSGLVAYYGNPEKVEPETSGLGKVVKGK